MAKKLFVILLLISFWGCGTQSEKEMLDSAKKSIDDQNYKEALQEFEQFVSEFPDSPNRGVANFEIAKLYQGNVADNLSKKESMEKAVEHYKVVYDEFRDMDEAPSALFMSAFIMANELHRYDDAKTLYTLFIERYPDHELAVSAQNELDNLGLSPEEILKKSGGEVK